MRMLLDKGTTSFLIVKYTATAVGVMLLLVFSRVRIGGLLSAEKVLWGLFGIYSALIIYHIFLRFIAITT